MKQLNNWDNNYEKESSSKYETLPKGIYTAKIVNVVDVPDSEYLKIFLDIVKDNQTPEHDKYVGFFKKQYDNLPADVEKKWSYQGTWYASYKDTATEFFHNFITAITRSNNGFVWNWDEKTLLNKFCVLNYGEVENEYNGNVSVLTKIGEVRSLEALRKGEIKELKFKPLKKETTENKVVFTDKDLEIDENDLPF